MKMIMYPCSDGWDTQAYSNAHRALDFGWLSSISKDGKTPIYACDDGVIEFEGFYYQNFGGKTYYPIGVVIRHTNWSDENDYFSIYWHMSRTDINIGDHVVKGQQIGLKGDTGMANGVHLHFQVIKVNKGAALPDQHTKDNWTALSLDPTDWIEVYDGQIFKYTGNFDLKHHTEKTPEEYQNEIATLTNELVAVKEENNKLKSAVDNFYKEIVEIYE